MAPAQPYHVQTRQEEEIRQGGWTEPRKVLAMQSSHRGKRGVTAQVCAALARGMEQAGARVETVHLADLDMAPCRGCFQCWTKRMGHCPIDDDLSPVLAGLPGYDLMLWAMPLYVDGMPGLMKNAVDRMMLLTHPAIVEHEGRCLHPSQHAALPLLAVAAVCGFREKDNFAPLKAHMEALARDQHTPLVAFLERPESLGLMLPQAREGWPKVEDALAAAGRQIITNGSVAPELAREISRPLLPRSQYLELGQNWWKGRK